MRTEKELLQLLKDGNEEAVKLIFERYYVSLCLYAESILKNHQIAEEIVEDIFIHIWVHASETSIVDSVRNYLFRSTHNNCLKYLNRLKTEKKIFDNKDYTFTDHEILHSLHVDYPIANMIAAELEIKAGEILETLPGQCKEIYALSRFENLSYSEIAAKLNITVGTVKTQMSRAFQKFRQGLKEFLPILLLFVLKFLR
jgi:RNA polymerase sigma-70 factor, ECF subfamily